MKNKKNDIIEKEKEEDRDVAIKIEQPSLTNSSTLNTTKVKNLKYCSFFLKLVGLLIIVGVVLLFAFLPNYIRSKNADNNYSSGLTDPTNAILPGDGGSRSEG